MAAQPIPIGDPTNEVEIDSSGTVSGEVQVNNGGEVKFNVTSYGIDPHTGQTANTCIVTITSANISWTTLADAGQNTIKVGNG
jgi:hypothetical protein